MTYAYDTICNGVRNLVEIGLRAPRTANAKIRRKSTHQTPWKQRHHPDCADYHILAHPSAPVCDEHIMHTTVGLMYVVRSNLIRRQRKKRHTHEKAFAQKMHMLVVCFRDLENRFEHKVTLKAISNPQIGKTTEILLLMDATSEHPAGFQPIDWCAFIAGTITCNCTWQ